jgi:GST-like protein
MPADVAGRYGVIQWLMFQVGGIGPMLGQNHHFRNYAPENIPYAVSRYTREAGRLYGVMDQRLSSRPYLAGDYSIADMACFPWLRYPERQGQDLADFPNLKRWFDAIEARPAVQRGLEVLADRRVDLSNMDDATRSVLYGDRQYERR